MITPSKEQSKRSAAHIFAAFQYQWDYFVLQLLATNDDTITVSFELLDDVDKQTGECITLYQIKHSVQKNAKNETINLSNRDTDLWKTISIWMEFIDEQPDVLASHKFVLGEFYQFNLSSCIRQQNSLTAQFVSFSLANLANIFYPPRFLQ